MIFRNCCGISLRTMSSRLIIKNLPKSITEDKLREKFSEVGIVTDTSLKYTKDGKFRHFGFIGFKTEEAALNAKNKFNNTFIGSCKINVQIASDLGDTSKPRAWSKYAKDSSLYMKENKLFEKKKKVKDVINSSANSIDILEKYKDNVEFKNFLKAHKKKQSWDNDHLFEVEHEFLKAKKIIEDEKEVSDPPEDSKSLSAHSKISDLQYLKSKTVGQATNEIVEEKNKKYKDFFTVKLTGLPYKTTKKDIKSFFTDLRPKSIRVPQKIKGIAYVGFILENDQTKALNKSKSYLNGKKIFVSKYQKVVPGTDVSSSVNKWKEKEEELEKEEGIAETGRLFMRNLSYSVTEEDLTSLLQKYGPLSEIILPIDKITRKVKGFAFVTFMFPEHAFKAFSELDGTTFQGRLLHIITGKPKHSEADAEGDTDFKRKKNLKEKAKAGSSHNWNTLFLGTSAVAQIMSEKYETSKRSVFDDSGEQSAAVRLALGETQIVNETRDFLLENDVHIEAFDEVAKKQRSKTVILVKNLPPNTAIISIKELFEPYGLLGRVVMPNWGVTSIVEFLDANEARTAFKKLAYTKFQSVPLYLEWAPTNIFTRDLTPEEMEAKIKKKEDQISNEESNRNCVDVEENIEPDSDVASLFVKNLNFDTEECDLKKHFEKCGRVCSVTISKKKDLKNPGKMLSMGYGFVQYQTQDSLNSAIKELQNSILNSHKLEIKKSNRADIVSSSSSKTTASDKKDKPSTKILVRNIPFEAKKKEVEDLFKTFGTLQAVRLPKKLVGTGSHRGFAFVEYVALEDAKRAFKAMSHSTHLYGRRLVLEWASMVESLDDIRKRTANHFHDPEPQKNKKSKFIESLSSEV